MPKDKLGNKLTWKEYGERWKEGIEGITPLQQSSMQLRSINIMLIGLSCGFTITLFNLKNLWWLSIILGGGFFNTSVSWIGTYQRKRALKRIEKEVAESEIE
jgi:hypothetical protein